jgi:membrane-associated protease RseP (regulator of RpoE activity)
MAGPKHLWSGNWQAESREPEAAPTEPVPPPHPAAGDPVPVRRPSHPVWRVLLAAAAATLVVAVALAELLPGSAPGGRRGATTPNASVIPSSPSPSPTLPSPATAPGTASANNISGRPVTWLGMQISTVENVGVVIQTVQLGSPADAAGLDPGDIIESVNGHAITAADQLRGAVRGLKAGEAVQISVERGSTLFATVADFAGPPTTSP